MSDRSFAMEMQYWLKITKRIENQIAKLRIEEIYDEYVERHRDKILKQIRKLEDEKKTSEKQKKQPFTSLAIENLKQKESS